MPYTVDLKPGPEGQDAPLSAHLPNNNYGEGPWDHSAWGSYIYKDGLRYIGKFDLSAIPSNAIITNATLTMIAGTPFNSTHQFKAHLHRVTEDWDESTVTFNSWSRPGGVFAEEHASTIFTSPGGTSAGDKAKLAVNFEIPDLVSGWYDGTFENYGFLLYPETLKIVPDCCASPTNVYSTFYHFEAAPELQPTLSIEYDLITLKGTSGDDKIVDRAGVDDVISALAGNDRVFSNAGDDIVSGGAGDDYLDGGDGNDWLNGGIGNDKLYGQEGDDQLLGKAGNDELFGGNGNDHLFGDAGADDLRGGNGDDVLYGGADNDKLFGNDGNDILNGGDGDDTLYGDDGDDILRGGLGNDRLFGKSGADTFVLAFGEGSDLIVDFEIDLDQLGLAGGLTFGQLDFVQAGADTEISVGGELLATLHATNADLISDSSHFVTV